MKILPTTRGERKRLLVFSAMLVALLVLVLIPVIGWLSPSEPNKIDRLIEESGQLRAENERSKLESDIASALCAQIPPDALVSYGIGADAAVFLEMQMAKHPEVAEAIGVHFVGRSPREIRELAALDFKAEFIKFIRKYPDTARRADVFVRQGPSGEEVVYSPIGQPERILK